MDGDSMNWETVLIALLGGGLVQGLASLANYLAKKREIVVTDDASVRDSLQKQVDGLMTERKNLVDEVSSIASRCGDIEKENRELSRSNRELNEQILKLERAAFEKERTMQLEIDRLGKEVEALKDARKTPDGGKG
jgi:chromosome segregation ATPase